MAIAGPTLERPIKLASLLEVGLKTKPNEPALVSLERTWSWRELDQASTRLAGQYLALGLAPGDRVASLLPNRGALLVHYLGLLQGRACRDAAQLSLPGPGDRSCSGSQRCVAVGRARRAGRRAGRERTGPSASLGPHQLRRRGWCASPSGRTDDLGWSGGRLAAAAARCARVYLFHVRQHGQAEGRDAFARHVRLDGGQRHRRSGVNAGRRFPAGDVGLAHCRDHRSRSPGWLPGPVSRSRDPSAATNCCRCFATRGRRCCACCPPRFSAWCATTERRGKISNPFVDASPAATRSRRSWSASSWM